MRVLILANGDSPTPSLARRLAAANDLLIATDGAAHRAQELGLIPDIVCGDYDSVRLEVAREAFPRARFLATPDQDLGDLEKALQVAQELGADAVTIIGASGGRIDHTLANYALLLRYSERRLTIVDDLAAVWAVSGSGESEGVYNLEARPGDTVSLISFDGRARVSIRGVTWPLANVQLPVGTHGVSNVAAAERIELRVEGGAVLVCHLPKKISAVEIAREEP